MRASGWDVRVFERTSTERRRGTGFLFLPNGIAAARSLGLWDRLAPVGAPLRRFQRWGPQSVHVSTDPFDAHGFVHGAFVNALEAALPQGVVRHEASVVDVLYEGGRVRSALLEGGEQVEADLYVAADGVRSVVRQRVVPAHVLVPADVHEVVNVVDAPDVAQALGDRFVKIEDPANGWALGAVPCAGAVVWFLQFDPVRGELLTSDDGPRRRRFVEARVGRLPAPLDGLLARTDYTTSYLWRAVDLDPLPSMAFGNLVIVGDAAHPLLPFTSQGVASAMEDALALGACLDDAPSRDDALRRFSEQRLPVVTHYGAYGRRLRDRFLGRAPDDDLAYHPWADAQPTLAPVGAPHT